jgi:hypothetical protein
MTVKKQTGILNGRGWKLWKATDYALDRKAEGY